MKNFLRVQGEYARHYLNPRYAAPHHGPILPVRILGIDPGVRSGFVVINARNWTDNHLEIDQFSYADVSDMTKYPGHIEKVRAIGEALEEVIKLTDPIAMAIESPVMARRPNISTILQARMFQHLIDKTHGLYYLGFSEIHPASSRAVVTTKEDRQKGKTKDNVLRRVGERFQISFVGMDRKEAEALADSVTVVLAFLKNLRESHP